jgi:hypothetical protein
MTHTVKKTAAETTFECRGESSVKVKESITSNFRFCSNFQQKMKKAILTGRSGFQGSFYFFPANSLCTFLACSST